MKVWDLTGIEPATPGSAVVIVTNCTTGSGASEYDQKIPQSHTADQHRHREEVPQNTEVANHQKDNQSKTTSSLFPIKIFAKPKGHKVLNNKTRTTYRNPTNNLGNKVQSSLISNRNYDDCYTCVYIRRSQRPWSNSTTMDSY